MFPLEQRERVFPLEHQGGGLGFSLGIPLAPLRFAKGGVCEGTGRDLCAAESLRCSVTFSILGLG